VSEAKHTPGPLAAGLDMPEVANNNPDPLLIWKDSTCVGSARSFWIPLGEQLANAKLWAAAPDLLAAAQEAVAVLIEDGRDSAARSLMDAIEKAKGEPRP
jgi:hypothetical protein